MGKVVFWFVLLGALSIAIASLGIAVLVMAIAVFMILDQLRIATEIVTITYAALLGSAALGMALAFGLGGRDVANRMLEDAYRRQRSEGQQPLATGRGAQRGRAD